MEVPAKLMYSIVGAVAGAFGVIGAAVLKYLGKQDEVELERDRMQAEIEDQLRSDILDAYKTEKNRRKEEQARRIEAEQQVAKYEDEIARLESRVKALNDELDNLDTRLQRTEEHTEKCEQQLLQVATRLEEDSDVEWGVEDV